MHRNLAQAIVQLCLVALLVGSTGPARAQTKVACIGDSITALPSSWCGDLSTKLGAGYTVSNFGVSGTNLAKSVAQPYWSSAQYTPSHTFAPNIVIIMLGTNDAIPNTWNGGKSHFEKDYEELIDTYTSLASKPKVYMIIPTPIGTSPFGHDGNLLATEIIPVIKMVAMNKMVPTVDAFTAFGGTSFDPGLYGAMDQVHPNAKGQQIICDAVYAVLMSSGALGGAAGSGGAVGGATAGAGGMAGNSAIAGGNANAGGAGLTGGANAVGAGRGAAGMLAAGMAGAAANTAATGSAGSRANAGGMSAAGTSSVTVAGSSASTGTSVNPVAGAATVGPTAPPAESGDGGCRLVGSSTRHSGPTALFVFALGVALRRRRRA